jgi:hypothetical protein
VAADVVRIENGVLAEHWDVLQDEATKVRRAVKKTNGRQRGLLRLRWQRSCRGGATQ